MKNKIVTFRNWLIFYFYTIKAFLTKAPFKTDASKDFLVTIASYPERDHLLPAVFQKLETSTVLPKGWILVLSIEEYSQNKLPKHIEKLVNKGVEIIWSENNPFAVKTLVPVLVKYPNENLVALDDDFLYYRRNLELLFKSSNKFPNAIIGLVGKELYRKGKELNMFFRSKDMANINSPKNCVYFLKGSGTYYPNNSIHSKALDIEKIHEIVPGRGADMWFWAAAHAQGTEQICVGDPHNYDVGIGIPEYGKTITRELPNHDAMNQRFQRVIDYFGIRDKLISILPNNEENV